MTLITYLLVIVAVTSGKVSCKPPYKICVPKGYLNACEEMLQVPTKANAVLQCVPARDRLECLHYVKQRQADLVPVEPEDMYMASKIATEDFVVVLQYRSNEELDAEFHYESVAVIRKNLIIDNLDQLNGLKSCHSGVNRDVGYKIPLTVLAKREIFPKMTNRTISSKENELRALSTFFNQSCIAGLWSPYLRQDEVWKNRYNQLCALCEDPERCDYPDLFAGYEGALRCLVQNRGEVAFTKALSVKQFFGLSVGSTPSSDNPDEFAYLCVDGSKKDIKNTPCPWAARPRHGFLGHKEVLGNLKPLREKIQELSDIGVSSKPDWFSKVLGLSHKNHHVVLNVPITPIDYLNKANYTEVFERDNESTVPVVRLCVTSSIALEKCQAMFMVAFSRSSIRPKLECIKEDSQEHCLKSVRSNNSDIAGVDGLRVVAASQKYHLHPVIEEVYGSKKTAYYVVAVVKKDTSFKYYYELKGKKTCHKPDNFSGLIAPIYNFIRRTNTSSSECLQKFDEYFSGGSCLPVIDKINNNLTGQNISNFKKLCSENAVLKCLEDNGDIAFVTSADLSNFNETKYELLCMNTRFGGRGRFSNFQNCYVLKIPSRSWLASKDFLYDMPIHHTLLSLAKIVRTKSDLFNMYGEFHKNNNVIFSDAATHMKVTDTRDFENLKAVYKTIDECGLSLFI